MGLHCRARPVETKEKKFRHCSTIDTTTPVVSNMTHKSKDEEGGGVANLIYRLPVKLSANDRGHLNLVLIADEV